MLTKDAAQAQLPPAVKRLEYRREGWRTPETTDEAQHLRTERLAGR